MGIFRRIFNWNYDRDNMEYDKLHEEAMIFSELMEYLEATDKANEAKEIADVIFVAVGTLVKYVGPDKAERIMNVVMEHNEQKGSEKVDGKVIKKGVEWKAEDRIQEILDEEYKVESSFDSYMYDNEHIYKEVV